MSKVPKFSEVEQLKFRKVPKREIDAMNRRLAKHMKEREEEEEREEAERWKPKTEIIGTCRCKGKIVVHTTFTSEYNPSTGPMIIGPGSRGQFRRIEHSQCFCQFCGILYNPDIVKKRK